jgi:hypothetical protein
MCNYSGLLRRVAEHIRQFFSISKSSTPNLLLSILRSLDLLTCRRQLHGAYPLTGLDRFRPVHAPPVI